MLQISRLKHTQAHLKRLAKHIERVTKTNRKKNEEEMGRIVY